VGGFVLGELLLDVRSAELATGTVSDGPHLGEEIALAVHAENQTAIGLEFVGLDGVGQDDGGGIAEAVDALEDQSGRAVSGGLNHIFTGGQRGVVRNECEGDLHPEGLLCLGRRRGREEKESQNDRNCDGTGFHVTLLFLILRRPLKWSAALLAFGPDPMP